MEGLGRTASGVQTPPKTHTWCSFFWKASLAGLVGGSLSYLAGFQRLWSGRVVKLSLLGTAVGGLGAYLTKPSRKESAESRMKELLGKQFGPKKSINELAKPLENLEGGSDALEDYLPACFAIYIQEADQCKIGDSLETCTTIQCDMNKIFGSEKEINSLFRETFLRVLQKQNGPINIEIRGELYNYAFFLDILEGQKNLICISCCKTGDADAASKLMGLLDSCPNLVEVPRHYRRFADKMIAQHGSEYRWMLDLEDKIDEKQSRLRNRQRL